MTIEAKEPAPRRRYRCRWVVLTFCLCVLPLAPRAGVFANAEVGPSKGRIRVFAKSLEDFAKANYDRMLSQREQRRPK